jgi:hypothetical protein
LEKGWLISDFCQSSHRIPVCIYWGGKLFSAILKNEAFIFPHDNISVQNQIRSCFQVSDLDVRTELGGFDGVIDKF